jgi:hypothetical protein
MSLSFPHKELTRLDGSRRQASSFVSSISPSLDATWDSRRGLSSAAVPTRPLAPPGRIRTRLIADSDLDAVARLLVHGFPRSSQQDWLEIFVRLAAHPTPDGFPTYGYLMESAGVPVGTILLVSSTLSANGLGSSRCNLSSWYVSPAFRIYGHLFISRILQNDKVTYINVSPAPHTLRLLQLQGFTRYSDGQFFAATVAAMPFGARSVRVVPLAEDDCVEGPTCERELLRAHARFGCMSLWCVAGDKAHPFVLRRRMVKGCIPCAQLIYCRSIDELVRYFPPIARYLARRGMPLVMIDANGRIPGLVGIYIDGVLPKYYRGSSPPRLGDLAFTETALFGI